MTIRLLNAFGQQVWQGNISGTGKISIRNLPKGVYFIQCDDQDNGSVTKIVKQ